LEGDWNKIPIENTKDVMVGYYHIRAENIEQAIELAKLNPEFEYIPSALIEIRPIQLKDEETTFVSPS
jgi:hypothetical protein